MTAGIPQTGNGNAFDWPGGEGAFIVTASTGGNVGLQIKAPGGTWCDATNFAATSAISVAPGKQANFVLPAGPVRAAAGAATGVVCCVVGVPAN
jgi:hypothetical protein